MVSVIILTNSTYTDCTNKLIVVASTMDTNQMFRSTCICTQEAHANGASFSRSGSVVAPRPDHNSSAPPMLQAAASAAGPPLVASPYAQSYLQYGQVIPAMPHYPGQVYQQFKIDQHV